jgi:hypothetical protein
MTETVRAIEVVAVGMLLETGRPRDPLETVMFSPV